MSEQNRTATAVWDVLAQFDAQYKRLFELVTDPTGTRIKKTRSREEIRERMELSLRRTAAFLAAVGHPERAFKAVQIAGTSGKGSVTFMVAALLRQLGWRTGHHTSPYLQTPLEKLVCDNEWIRPSEFSELVDDFFELYDTWCTSNGEFESLLYGEAWVVLTFLYMAHQQVEWGVIETGLGGRFDPITTIPAELAIITNIGWDHVQSLGPELTDIAWHKAGIIKPAQDVITAVHEPELLAVIEKEAAEQGAALFPLGKSFDYQIENQQLQVMAPYCTYEGIVLPASGGYQWRNAAVAIAAVDVLAKRHGKKLTTKIINHAFAELTLPGRMEVVQEGPLVILDGAHNPHKMAALAQTIQQLYPQKQITAIVGAILSKDIVPMLAELAPIVNQFVVTQPFVPGKPAWSPQDLKAELALLTSKPVKTAATIEEALQIAFQVTPKTELILTTGSLYLVGEARRNWYPTEQLVRDAESRI